MQVDGCTILCASGRYVNPLDLRPDDVCIEDIAHHLGHQCRYSGAVRVFYSVAEHCCRIEHLLYEMESDPAVRLWGLLHDAAEAYLQDFPRPLKHHPDFGAYKTAEANAMQAIITRFDLLPVEPPIVKYLDLVLLATERRDLLPSAGNWTILNGVDPLAAPIEPWEGSDPRDTFLQSFEDCGGRA